MRIVLATALVLSAALCGCTQKQDRELTTEEYEVYLVVIKGRPEGPIGVSTTIDRLGEVSSGKLGELVPGLLPETEANWVAKNNAGVILLENFPSQDGYPMTPVEKMPESAHLSYSVSRVGFSKDGRQAFVRMYFSCGALCGEGAFFLLERTNGDWVITQESVYMKA